MGLRGRRQDDAAFPGGSAFPSGSEKAPPVLTALRRARPGWVDLEVDGRPWRSVPDQAVLGAGLALGVTLDRRRLRSLRRELRRSDALATAGRGLTRRSESRARVAQRLERAGVAPAARREALDTLERLGLVDDVRLAGARAESLVRRGWGDAAIVAKIIAEGIPDESALLAVEELPCERDRAIALAEGQSDRRRAASLLTRRGFGDDAIEAAVGPLDELPPPAVR